MTEKTIQNKQVIPLMQLPVIAFFLAIAAGSLDGYAFFTAKTFATFQSGNIIMLGYTLATEPLIKIIPYLGSILCFGLGAMATVALRSMHKRRGKVWTFRVLVFEIAVLILVVLITNIWAGALSVIHVVWILAFIAGMQGNAFHKIGEMLYGNIAVTLNVQLAFSYFAEVYFQKTPKAKKDSWYRGYCYFIVLVGFALGAAISALLTKHFGSYTLLFTIMPLIAIYLTAAVLHKQSPSTPIDSD